jgi:rhodanese-related sulfurtransferase
LLGEQGIKDVKALLGGYAAWVDAGYPVAKGDEAR